MTHTPPNLGSFTTLVSALQPETSIQLLQETYQLLTRIEPLLDPTNTDQANDLRDRIFVHLGNTNNH